MKGNENAKIRCYTIVVNDETAARVWLSFSRCSLSGCDANWCIVTFGESPKHVNREDGSAYFRSTQIISDQLELISYEFEDAGQVYSVIREDELYVFRDDQHIISKGQFEPFMFIMEDNNFAAISALCYLLKHKKLNSDSVIKYLPLGYSETLKLDVGWSEGNIVSFAGVDVVCDSAGFIEKVSATGSMGVLCSMDAMPECHDKPLIKTTLSQAVNYTVHHEEGDIQTCVGRVQSCLAMNLDVKRSGETPLAVFIGGTGRYTSSGHVLSGLNVGYGRFLDGLAHHGIDNYRYNRFTHFFSRAVHGHEEIVQQAQEVVNHLVKTYSRPIILIGHSYGGVVAAQVAAEMDEIFSLVMISTPAGTLGENTQWQRNNAMNKIEDSAILESYLEKAQIFDDVVAGHSAFEANSMDQLAAEFVRSTKDISVRQFANDVNCPTLLIHGARDEQVPVSDIQKLEHEFGTHGQWVRTIVFEELGHFLKYRDSDPAQVRKVMEFDRDVADLILSMPRPIPDHEQ